MDGAGSWLVFSEKHWQMMKIVTGQKQQAIPPNGVPQPDGFDIHYSHPLDIG